MPIVSQQQRKFLWATNPELAKRWEKHTPKGKKLPKYAKKKKKTNTLAEIFDEENIPNI